MNLINEVLVIFLILHGLIHLLGFAKSSKLMDLDQFTLDVPKFYGFLWLSAAMLFLISGVFIILNFRYWSYFVILSLVVSQILIFKFWQDAKIGTIANTAISIALFISLSLK